MTAEVFTPTVAVTMTPSAVKHVRKQLEKKPDAKGIRLAIKKSGCSGFKYETQWVEDTAADDKVFHIDGVDVFVKEEHLPLVNGIEIDFVTEGVNSMFQFRNPNATAECGCGESFTVAYSDIKIEKSEARTGMQEREVVLTKREVEARLVPSGTEIMIPSDTFVTITQSLGGTFTVAVNGNLARIEGHNADALGKKPLESSFETPEDGTVNENQVWEAMQNCYDPEIPVNVVDLGLIYECRIENGTEDGNHVYVLMTLTAAGCGMGPVITEDVKTKLEHVPNVDKVTVELTFDPPWSNEMLTDEAKLELGML